MNNNLSIQKLFGINISDTDILLLDESIYTKPFLDIIRLDKKLNLCEIHILTDNNNRHIKSDIITGDYVNSSKSNTSDIIKLHLNDINYTSDVNLWYLQFESIIVNSIQLYSELKQTINIDTFKSYINEHFQFDDITPYINYFNIRIRQGNNVDILSNIDNLSIKLAQESFDNYIQHNVNYIYDLNPNRYANQHHILFNLNKHIKPININKDYIDNNQLFINKILIDNKIVTYDCILELTYTNTVSYLHTLAFDFLIKKLQIKKRYTENIKDSVDNLINFFDMGNQVDSLLFEIDDNIILTQPKIASTTCCNIVHQRFKDYFEYTDVRSSCSYIIKNDNNKLTPYTECNNRISTSTIKAFNDILSNKSNKKLYILTRNPIITWIQAVKEDLSEFFRNVQTTRGNETLFNLLTSFLNKDDTNIDKYLIHLNKLKTNESYRIKNNRFFQLENLFTTIVLDSDTYLEDFHNELFSGIWNYFLNPKTQYDEYSISPNWNVGNIITEHYSTYLTTYWLWYTQLNKPNYIEFIDIDNTKFDLITMKNTDNNLYDNDYVDSKKNITPMDFKKCFYDAFLQTTQVLQGNHPNLLKYMQESLVNELITYKYIKDNFDNSN